MIRSQVKGLLSQDSRYLLRLWKGNLIGLFGKSSGQIVPQVCLKVTHRNCHRRKPSLNQVGRLLGHIRYETGVRIHPLYGTSTEYRTSGKLASNIRKGVSSHKPTGYRLGCQEIRVLIQLGQ